MYEGYAPHSDSTHVVGCFIRYVSPTYFKVFRLQPLSGSFEAERWDKNEYPMPVLMSETLSDSLFSGRNGVGETCFNPYFLNSVQPETNYKVMAVLPAHKTDEYERSRTFYLSSQFAADLAGITLRCVWLLIPYRDLPNVLCRICKGNYLSALITYTAINSYGDMKEAFDIEQGTVNYLNTTYAVILFFVFNIFFGMLGTFWFRTRKNRSEIALRMALGLRSDECIWLVYVLEGILLLVSAAIPAVLCLCEYADGGSYCAYINGTCLGTFFALFCVGHAVVGDNNFARRLSLPPARKAMRIEPADALHNE